MPTLNSYADEPGFFIHANPSGDEFMTYQMKPAAYSLIRADDELEPQESIPWPKIKALMALELIRTDSSGVIHPGSPNTPAPEDVQQGEPENQSLTIDQGAAEDFLVIITDHQDLNRATERNVREWLGLSRDKNSGSSGGGRPVDAEADPDLGEILSDSISDELADVEEKLDTEQLGSSYQDDNPVIKIQKIPWEHGVLETQQSGGQEFEVRLGEIIESETVTSNPLWARTSFRVEPSQGITEIVSIIDTLTPALYAPYLRRVQLYLEMIQPVIEEILDSYDHLDQQTGEDFSIELRQL